MIHLLLGIIYLSFISLGLPDALLGSAWPSMHGDLGAPLSYAGLISIIISAGTILSSLLNDRFSYRLGTGRLTALSVGLTALALSGFSISSSFWHLCLWAIPYGLGAGAVDASLNNYVALHYSSRDMSWLHCMWGVGASIGPYIMGYFLSRGKNWSGAYLTIALLQLLLTLILCLSLPLWKGRRGEGQRNAEKKPLSLREIFGIAGAGEIMLAFFAYCALEQTVGLWASSYLVFYKGVETERAAFFAALFFIGITAGRGLNGFLSMRWHDRQLIRLGLSVILLGIIVLLLPFGEVFSLGGLILIGLGCAPVYPCIIHSTPENFGAERSQALIGVQMASAYLGSLTMPSVFGMLAEHSGVRIFPFYLLLLTGLIFALYSRMLAKTGSAKEALLKSNEILTDSEI